MMADLKIPGVGTGAAPTPFISTIAAGIGKEEPETFCLKSAVRRLRLLCLGCFWGEGNQLKPLSF